MGRTSLLPLLVAGLACATAPLAAAADAPEFQIVVHQTVEGSRISRSVLADIYRGNVIRWGNEIRILPVDQSSQAPVRQAFTRDVLHQSLGEVQEYWTQRMATDRQTPPPTKPSDAEVLAFVAGKKGAIGYVSAGAALPDGVKVLTLTD
jgi:ABC-type phosphate transport system substrate-binding protein